MTQPRPDLASRRAVLATIVAAPLAVGRSARADAAPVIVEFAGAVSGGDPAVMAKVEALIATPPTTLEGIGFYGMTGAPPGERTALGIVSVLMNAGFLPAFEDKYVYDLPAALIAQGVLADTGDPALDPFTPMLNSWNEETGLDYAAIRAVFPAHVAALTDAAAAAGHRLLSVSLGQDGDTFLLWPATPDQAAAWLGRPLYAGPNLTRWSDNDAFIVAFAVIEPDWERYWTFLTYALDMPKEYWPFPGAA